MAYWETVHGHEIIVNTVETEVGEVAMVNLDDVQEVILAERVRCEQLFLAFADDWWGWKVKNPDAATAIMEMLEDIRSGATATAKYIFLPSDPEAQGLPSIRTQDALQTSEEKE